MSKKSKAIDWDAEAVAMAEYVTGKLMDVQRGAMPWRQAGVSVIFGNDDLGGDPRTRVEVARVREWLAELDIKILGFGADSWAGYSWAMLVETSEVRNMNRLVWGSWGDGNYDGVQYQAALAGIAKSGVTADHSAN